jgi:hypothetical protein
MLAQVPPSNARELLMWPLALCLIAFIMWFIGWAQTVNGKKGWVRWLALLPLVWAIVVGVTHVWNLHNPELGAFYRGLLVMRTRTLQAHYVALVLPILTAIAFWVVAFFMKRRMHLDEV